MEKLLLLLSQKSNRQLLRSLLESKFQVLEGESPADLEAEFDLAILDAPALGRLREAIQARRAAADPLFLPFLLLVTRAEIGLATGQLWRTCDELIFTPIEKLELQARVEVLLRARRLSREMEVRYYALARNSPVGIFISRRGKVAWVNPALADLLHRPATTLVGAGWEEWLPGEERELVRDLEGRLTAGAPPRSEVVLLMTGAGRRWGDLRLATLAPGEYLGFLADVTGERETARMKDDLLSMVSHEFNTPLAAILGYSELLLNNPGFGPEERREFLDHIHGEGERLARIVGDLLNLARLRAGRDLPVRKEKIDLFPLLAEQLGRWRKEHPERSFRLDLPGGPVAIRADRELLAQAIDNLIGNAVKFSPAGAPVEVELAAAEGVRITVVDHGIGMTAEQAEKAWEVFYRADPSDSAIGGFGLGLTVARCIAEAHGGRLALESAPGRGTVVTLELPEGNR